MGRRTGENPSISQTVIQRICNAMDLKPRELSDSMGLVFREDIKPLLKLKSADIAVDDDLIWWEINKYMSEMIGNAMAVQRDLQMMLQKERAKRIERHTKYKWRKK
jgi:hypothetical protein